MARLTFWQDSPSIHQAPLIQELASHWQGAVRVVIDTDLVSHRAAQGWSRPEYAPAQLIVAPALARRRELARGAEPQDLHVFSGLRNYPGVGGVRLAMREVARSQATCVLLAEAPDPDGARGQLRRLAYRLEALRWRRRLDLILAIGETGTRWYQGSGFPSEKIFPFAYFVAEAAGDTEAVEAIDDPREAPSLIFVGNLIPLKGLDLLLRTLALPELSSKPWNLDVIGAGAQQRAWQALAERLGLSDRLRWLGRMPNPEARARIAAADLLLLPGRYDGWGAVVNEALMAGTPVIASDGCGASDLLRQPRLGAAFRSGSTQALAAVLTPRLEQGAISSGERSWIRSWAKASISPTAGAAYLLQVFRHAQRGGGVPRAPWRAVVSSTPV